MNSETKVKQLIAEVWRRESDCRNKIAIHR